jgi:hypothetical protein
MQPGGKTIIDAGLNVLKLQIPIRMLLNAKLKAPPPLPGIPLQSSAGYGRATRIARSRECVRGQDHARRGFLRQDRLRTERKACNGETADQNP